MSVVGLLALLVVLLGNGSPDCNCCGSPKPPTIFWSPEGLSFEDVAVGECSEILSVEIRNTGAVQAGASCPTLTLSCEVSISAGSDDFVLVSGEQQFTLESGSSRLVTVQFCPITAGQKTGTLRILHNGGNADWPIDVPRTGTGN